MAGPDIKTVRIVLHEDVLVRMQAVYKGTLSALLRNLLLEYVEKKEAEQLE